MFDITYSYVITKICIWFIPADSSISAITLYNYM